MKKVVKENDKAILFVRTGVTTFRGCQCFKDCSCADDFQKKPFTVYEVRRKNSNLKTYDTLDEAEKRWDLLQTLPRKTYDYVFQNLKKKRHRIPYRDKFESYTIPHSEVAEATRLNEIEAKKYGQ